MSMTRTQLLLIKIAEECAEIAQRALKAAQFGLDEVQPGQPSSNAEWLSQEFTDLFAVAAMLEYENGTLSNVGLTMPSARQLSEKIKKVEEFILLSQKLGMVEPRT